MVKTRRLAGTGFSSVKTLCTAAQCAVTFAS